MNFLETNIAIMLEVARERSEGDNIDEYWQRVLPEALKFVENEIFLTLHRAYTNQPMKKEAARAAQTLPSREIGNLDYGTMWLHYFTCEWWLNMSNDTIFQALVDQNHGVIYDTSDPTRWVKPSLIWVPHFDGMVRQIFLSLVERYKQYYFAQRCWNKLIRDARRNEYAKCTFIQLSDSHGLRREQKEAIHWLSNQSREIAPDFGEDALQNWLEKLLPLPPHIQIQKCGATGKAIRDGAKDMRDKGGQHKPIQLDDGLINKIPDASTIHSHEGTDVERLLECLQSCRAKIEKVLSKGKPKLGKRRFKVMEMLTHTSCQKTIAKALNVSEGTITGDIQIIKKARDRIKEILYD